ncbi:autotransporter assembly complex protein TamA [Rhodobacteraceae bacterium HSP-20]|uniref:Autotransporter assembly complex protein TamA n=1 Tax=Paragemmobacter amnigenus TaxID=2852097 RepID=A0ABS6J463_9RHOB|nr:autotransporter assembly complex family protein [Rhodobacter amnigenus]MBU9698302.1 autotransporter assembly complex protein TamA [Rhodobacter amnigenus]MBV4389529.1 autotransporter assembly complex protein TamA [Rhodobacter amnigenus]
MSVAGQAAALERLDFAVAGGDGDLTAALRAASLLVTSELDGQEDAQDLFAVARADYGKLLGALYAAGHYSGVINILIDGREAAGIAPLDAPSRIDVVTVRVDPGPAFRLSEARIGPLARGTVLPEGFAAGRPALSGVVREAAVAGVGGWRSAGHAKAAVSGQEVTANHADATLAARIALDPGPRLRFGPLTVTGEARMREARVIKIAGLPEGEVFSPEELDRAANRLRRTGVFRSVTMTEAEGIMPPDLLSVTATVVEEKPRRFSFGGEIASFEGLSLTGYWLHRNLLGGAERLRVDGEVANLGAQSSGVDYTLGVSLERPATFTPDTTVGIAAELGHLDEEDYQADVATVGLTATHYFTDALTGRIGLDYEYAEGRDRVSGFLFRNVSIPVGVTWDRRNDKTDATAGWYLEAEVKPFFGFGTTGSGTRSTLDARGYLGLGAEDRFVLAGRVQAGAVTGSALLDTPRDDLFYSGGGGTVRGQPYQSLGVLLTRGLIDSRIGGTHFLGAQMEARARVTDRIGIVGFYDVGRIDVGGFGNSGDWHSGAGLGLRYDTGFGPIRLDVATPVGGNTGDGVQIYVGLGQAF